MIILSFLFKTPLGKKLSIETPFALIIECILAGIFGYAGMKVIGRFVKTPKISGEEAIFRKFKSERHAMLH